MSARDIMDGAPGGEEAVLLCISRLQALIEAETQALKRGGQIDLENFNQRKSHALIELMRLTGDAGHKGRGRLKGPVTRLASLLAENAEALDLHLRATQEVAALLLRKILEEESDGTYQKHGASRRQP